jgi:hypothetical protein
MFITMLFNPRQIADKFNEMQLGMIVNREIIDTQDQIQDTGKIEAYFGNISFKDVRFSYIASD